MKTEDLFDTAHALATMIAHLSDEYVAEATDSMVRSVIAIAQVSLKEALARPGCDHDQVRRQWAHEFEMALCVNLKFDANTGRWVPIPERMARLRARLQDLDADRRDGVKNRRSKSVG